MKKAVDAFTHVPVHVAPGCKFAFNFTIAFVGFRPLLTPELGGLRLVLATARSAGRAEPMRDQTLPGRDSSPQGFFALSEISSAPSESLVVND